MLNAQDFAAWGRRIGLSDKAQSVVAHIRSSDPARRVGGGRSNVTGRYPSRKMGVTIQFESHRVELPAIIQLEHDDSVLEYFDQAPAIKLDYPSLDGRSLGVLHTPDFFVLRTHSAGWEECKTEEELARLSERNPNRYCRDSQSWICPPGRQYAERFGFYYQVRSSAGINWLFQRNIQFLEDYLRAAPQVSSPHRQQVLAQVAAQPACSLEGLFQATDGEVTRDEIYALIAIGEIFVDLLSSSLLEPEKVSVWLRKPPPQDLNAIGAAGGDPTLRAGDAVEWDSRGWTVLNAGINQISLLAEDGAIIEIPSDKFHERMQWKHIAVSAGSGDNNAPPVQRRLLQASEADLSDATRRYQVISQALRGEPHDDVAPRTLRRWAASYRAAQDELGCGYLGLLPKPNRGNPAKKLPKEAHSLMAEFIDKDYETLKQKTMYAAWSALKLNCDRQQIVAPATRHSLSLFIRALVRHRQKSVEASGLLTALSLSSGSWNNAHLAMETGLLRSVILITHRRMCGSFVLRLGACWDVPGFRC